MAEVEGLSSAKPLATKQLNQAEAGYRLARLYVPHFVKNVVTRPAVRVSVPRANCEAPKGQYEDKRRRRREPTGRAKAACMSFSASQARRATAARPTTLTPPAS